MSVRCASFKKYPQNIIKKPVINERNQLYKEVVLPCLAKNNGRLSENAIVQEIRHIPPQKLSANDLSIFLSFCKEAGMLEIFNGNVFIQKLIYQSLEDGNEELFLMLLDFELKEKRSGSGNALSQNSLNALLNSVTLIQGWQRSMRKLIEMGADVNQETAGKSLLEHVVDQFSTHPAQTAYAKAAVLLENGAVLHGDAPKFSWGDFSTPAVKPLSHPWITLDFIKELAQHHPAAFRKMIEQDWRLLYRSDPSTGENVVLFTASQYLLNPADKNIAKLLIELFEMDRRKPFEMWGDPDYELMVRPDFVNTFSSALKKACEIQQADVAKALIFSLNGYINLNEILKIACENLSLPIIEACLVFSARGYGDGNDSLVDAKLLARISSLDPAIIFGEKDSGCQLLALLASRFSDHPDDQENAQIFEVFLRKYSQTHKEKEESFLDGLIGANLIYCSRALDAALMIAFEKNNELALKIIRTRMLIPDSHLWLQRGCFNGSFSILEECLSLGADPHLRSSSGTNAFDEALCGSSKEKEKMILALLGSSKESDSQVIAKILQQDEAYTSWKSEANKTFLALAAAKFLKDCSNADLAKFLETLVEKAASSVNDVYKIERNSSLAPMLFEKVLEKALEMGLIPLATKIMKAKLIKADLNQQLRWACKIGELNFIEELLELGADPYDCDADGNGPFHFALQGKSKEKDKIFPLLHRFGKDVHTPGVEGFTPMVKMHFRGADASSLLTKEEQDFVQKKISGHVCSVPNGGGFEFEKGHSEIMSGEVASSLKNFFADDSEEMNREVREALVRIFEKGASIADPQVLSDQIQKGEPSLIEAGWTKHAMVIAVIEDPLPIKGKDDLLIAVCNRGDGILAKENTIQVFRGSRSKFTPKIISEILNNRLKWTKDQGMKHYYKIFLESVSSDGTIVQDEFCRMLQKELCMSLQRVGNCSYSALKAALRFLWAVLLHKEKKEMAKDLAAQAKIKTKRWSVLAQVDQLRQFSARFPQGTGNTAPADESHFLRTSHQKIKKKLHKITNFPRAHEGFAKVVSSNPFLAALETVPAIL